MKRKWFGALLVLTQIFVTSCWADDGFMTFYGGSADQVGLLRILHPSAHARSALHR